jgi:hypothetical protein
MTEGSTMNTKPTVPSRSSLSTTFAAALATAIVRGLLTTVAFLFQFDGAPMEQLVAAERACTERAHVSEREVCMREWLAATRASIVASK